MKDARAFFDTNIFVYFWDGNEPLKRQQAIALVDRAMISQGNYISAQVVQEFFNTAFRKFPGRMPKSSADEFCLIVLSAFQMVPSGLDTMSRAIALRERCQIAWYDAVIIASALQAECTVLYSEDFQPGQVFEGSLTVVNPFAAHKN